MMMTVELFIELGNDTSENDILNLCELLTLLRKQYNFRFGRVPPNKKIVFVDKNEVALDKARTRIILNSFLPKMGISYDDWKELFKKLGLKEEAE